MGHRGGQGGNMVTIDQVYMNDFGDVLKGTFVANDAIFSLRLECQL